MLNRVLAGLVLAGAAAVALATFQAPEQLIEQASQDIARQLADRREELTANTQELYALIDRVLLPKFDTRYAGQLVLGKHWRSASEAQRTRFIDAFYDFLLRSYARAVLEFDQNNIDILPPRRPPADGRAVVETVMRMDNGTTVPVNYSLRTTDAGWRVYDVRIEGISYVQNYRNQFNAEIAAKGLDAVIARLEKEAANTDTGEQAAAPSAEADAARQ